MFHACMLIKQCSNLFVSMYGEDSITRFDEEDSEIELTIALLKAEFTVKDWTD